MFVMDWIEGGGGCGSWNVWVWIVIKKDKRKKTIYMILKKERW